MCKCSMVGIKETRDLTDGYTTHPLVLNGSVAPDKASVSVRDEHKLEPERLLKDTRTFLREYMDLNGKNRTVIIPDEKIIM